MTNQESNPVRNGVIASVLAGVILAIMAKIWPPVMKFFIWVWEHIVSFVKLFTEKYSIPGWTILLLLLLALPTVVRFCLSFRKSEDPSYIHYVEDIFYGVKWRWTWIAGGISNLWCFCLRCESELVYDDSSGRRIYESSNQTNFICEHCGHVVVGSIAGGDKDYALSVVQREIRRKVRTGELPKAPQGT
jgi:hypothetical protein